LAVQILSVKYPELRDKFKEFKDKMAQDTIAADQQLNG